MKFNVVLLFSACVVANGSIASPALENAVNSEMALIRAGAYTPLYKPAGVGEIIQVKPFYLDKYQVTNQQFLVFTRRFDKWSKEKISPIFADANYLQQFERSSDESISNQPAVNVSWFSAMAYCEEQGKRLPTLDEWEYVGRASATDIDASRSIEFQEKILSWYSKPVVEVLADVRNAEGNYWGVHGMHGVVWELVRNFNSVLVSDNSKSDGALSKQIFCDINDAPSVDSSGYAAFIRYTLRSNYSSTYTLNSLGFRCAKDLE